MRLCLRVIQRLWAHCAWRWQLLLRHGLRTWRSHACKPGQHHLAGEARWARSQARGMMVIVSSNSSMLHLLAQALQTLVPRSKVLSILSSSSSTVMGKCHHQQQQMWSAWVQVRCMTMMLRACCMHSLFCSMQLASRCLAAQMAGMYSSSLVSMLTRQEAIL